MRIRKPTEDEAIRNISREERAKNRRKRKHNVQVVHYYSELDYLLMRFREIDHDKK